MPKTYTEVVLVSVKFVMYLFVIVKKSLKFTILFNEIP